MGSDELFEDDAEADVTNWQEVEDEISALEKEMAELHPVMVAYRDAKDRTNTLRRARGYKPKIGRNRSRSFGGRRRGSKRRNYSREKTDRYERRFNFEVHRDDSSSRDVQDRSLRDTDEEEEYRAFKAEKRRTRTNMSIDQLKQKFPCRRCGQKGHWEAECRQPPKDGKNFMVTGYALMMSTFKPDVWDRVRCWWHRVSTNETIPGKVFSAERRRGRLFWTQAAL